MASIPVNIGIGLNYRKHAEEGGVSHCIRMTLPRNVDRLLGSHSHTPGCFREVCGCEYLLIAICSQSRSGKADSLADTLAGPFEDVPISPDAKELDYEGELTIVIGKDTKNLTETQDPLDFVLGYTVGNDVSARFWQKLPQSGNQHGGAKSFDKFGPIGPVIASLKAVGDPETLKLRTWVNGELRQDGCTDDLIFGVREIIRFLSRGKTLRKGTIIMTGTPRYVAINALLVRPRH